MVSFESFSHCSILHLSAIWSGESLRGFSFVPERRKRIYFSRWLHEWIRQWIFLLSETRVTLRISRISVLNISFGYREQNREMVDWFFQTLFAMYDCDLFSHLRVWILSISIYWRWRIFLMVTNSKCKTSPFYQIYRNMRFELEFKNFFSKG